MKELLIGAPILKIVDPNENFVFDNTGIPTEDEHLQ